jgi:peptide chain release factor 2
LRELEENIQIFQELENQLKDLKNLALLTEEDEALASEIIQQAEEFREKLKKEEIRGFLNGKYDAGKAFVNIEAGAGGREAEDWVAMLLRMYQRYAEKQNWKVKIGSQTFGEPGGPEGRVGIKEVSLEIKGKHAYGFLKGENGVHRLVRISPFSEQSLRHTSFALVEVLPELEEKELEMNPRDLRVDTYRSSGPGGQYVNRRESAVRVTHLPTGLTASCQSERLQGMNKEVAMKVLAAKLQRKQEKEQEERLAGLSAQGKEASWGQQIRSYVLHPYQMVRDHQTGIKSSEVEAVLNGNLETFIEAGIRKDDH